MELSEHFRVIWRRRWRVVVASILLAGAVYGWRSSRPDVYEARALLNVVPGQVTAGDVSEQNVLFLARTFAGLADSTTVTADAVQRSGLHLSFQRAQQRLSVSSLSKVGFIEVTAHGPSPTAATRLANGMADALMSTVEARQQAALAAALGPIDSEIEDVLLGHVA